MLATVMNSMILRDALVHAGQGATVFSAAAMLPIAAGFQRQLALNELNSGNVVVLSAGTGNALVTTDSAASLRGIELGCDIVLKATHVDGVYDSDPKQNPDAVMYDEISFDEVLKKQLNVMDLTAFQQCQAHGMPIRVFNIEKPGALLEVVTGAKIGTLVS
jgi:uridylate kinase